MKNIVVKLRFMKLLVIHKGKKSVFLIFRKANIQKNIKVCKDIDYDINQSKKSF